MSVEGPERFTGGCLCGSVRIVASGRPYRVGVCHSGRLRRNGDAGGAFDLYHPDREAESSGHRSPLPLCRVERDREPLLTVLSP